jgi:hypothetical protein
MAPPSFPDSRKRSVVSEGGRRKSMSLPALADESLLRFYESIRKEVDTDRDSMRRGHRHFLANSEGIKGYADSLRRERKGDV